MVKKKQEWMSFHEDGKRFMQCKVCKSEYVQTGEDAVAVTCSRCVTRITISQMSLEEMMPSLMKKKTYLKWILWLNLILGFQNLYFYVSNDSLFNLVIGALNIGVWVFFRKLAGVKR